MIPSERLFRQLPHGGLLDDEAIDEEEPPLLDLLQDAQVSVLSGATMLGGATAQGSRSAPGIHSLVNRLLKRVAREIGTDQGLSENLRSYSFILQLVPRRGGAQAANENLNVSLQWIFDRGGWQLSAVNKALVYIFNITKGDRQVAKVLSGWQPNERSWVPSLATLDEVPPMARAFCKMAFALTLRRTFQSSSSTPVSLTASGPL
jgi:hypothetical protein